MADNQAGSSVGRIDGQDVAEAAKVGAFGELFFETVREPLQIAAERSTGTYVDWLAAMPPGTGLAAGIGLRLVIALIEERRSVWFALKLLFSKLKTLLRKRRK